MARPPISAVLPAALLALGPSAAPGADLVGWWSFNESSGSGVLDGSPFANPGTIHDATRVPGIVGGALSFDGHTSYVQVPHAAQYDIAGAVSVEAWIRMDATQYFAQPSIFDKSHRGLIAPPYWTGYTLQSAPGGSMAVNFAALNGTSAPEVGSVAPLNDGAWHFVAGTASAVDSAMRFYLDGVMTQEIPFVGPIAVNDGDVFIGRCWWWEARHFAGIIDEVKVYQGALTPAEVEEHYTDVVGASLVGWWSFDEGSGASVLDRSPYSNPGVIHDAVRVPGILGGALSFDGHGSFVQVPWAAQYDVTEAVSVEAWIRMSPEQQYTQPSVFDKSHRFWSGYTLQAAQDGGMAMNFVAMSDGAAPEVGSVLPLNDDEWHFIAGTASTAAGVMRFYTDGAMTQEIPFAGPIGVNDGDILVGRFWGWQERYFAGLIDEVKVYRGALTPSQILAHWSGAVDTPPAPSRPVASTLRVMPNPARHAAWIEQTSPFPSALRIYDAAGRLVRTLASDGPATSRVRWDTCDDAGRPVPTGMYFLRVRASSSPGARVLVVR